MTPLRRARRDGRAVAAAESVQRGGFVLGAIIGLLVGLALALGVAMYVTKVPVPFVDKVQTRTPEQDAAEAERNRNWDPNGPLANRSPVRPPVADTPAAPPPGISNPPTSASAVLPPTAAASKPARVPRDPAAILAGAVPGASSPASTKPAAETLMYFVQTGAFTRSEEADQQRAKLAFEGFAAKVTEREQNGRMLYRVRLGPFYKQEEADEALDRVREYAPPATLVRVARPAS
jgi:cell division protein FtsN